MSKKPILMTSENPEGVTLQDLLIQLQEEMIYKTNKIVGKDSPQAKIVLQNNLKIIEHFGAALSLVNASNGILNSVGPDQGPKGAPRI